MGRCAVRQAILSPHKNDETRKAGIVRVVYAASIAHCRPCPLREARPRLRCQNLEAAPSECHPSSVDLTRLLDRDHGSSHRNGTAPVARLQPMPDAMRVDAAFAQPTC